MVSRLKDTLLLVGDASSDRAKLRSIFESSYNLLEAGNVLQACLLLEQNAECVAAVISDFPLGDGSGLRNLVAVCRPDAEDGIPVIVLVSLVSLAARIFKMGSILLGMVGFLILAMLPVAIITSRIMWKKGVIKVVDVAAPAEETAE